MNHWDQRDFLREHARVARLTSKATIINTPAISDEEARRRRAASIASEEHTEGRVHRAPPAPVNYHAE